MPDFVLNDQGLQTPRFSEARALVVAAWRERFGSSQTASDSPDGLVIDTVALFLTLAWQGLAAVYANSFFRTASGTALQLIVDLFGTQPNEPTASTVDGIFYGTNGTTVLEGRTALVEDTEAEFSVDADATLEFTSMSVIRILQVTEGNSYAINDGFSSDAYIAQPGDSLEDVAEGVRAAAAGLPDLAVSEVYVQPDGFPIIVIENAQNGTGIGVSNSTDAGNDLETLAAARVPMTASETGPVPAFAGAMNSLGTAISGVDGVLNIEDATLGRATESPAELRARHLDRLNANATNTSEAIRGAVLDVEGVTFCRVFDNDDDEEDAAGRPPHSFEVFALGGADADVAAAIASKRPLGIRAFGDIETVVLTSQGQPKTIGFSRPTERYLHMRITVTTGEGWNASADNATAIEQAVAAALDEGGALELEQGDDVYRLRISRIADQTVEGIASLLVELDDTDNPGDVPTLANADITVAEDVLIRVDTSRIEVVVL